MPREEIIKKVMNANGKNVELNEKELVCIVAEWFKQHFKVEAEVTVHPPRSLGILIQTK